MATNGVILPAYVDEAGASGFVRDLTPARDHEFGLMCALLFDPDQHASATQAFTPGFEKFRDAAPEEAKLHITDAFRPGNERWRGVAEQVRSEYIELIKIFRPMVIYAARRLGLARSRHELSAGLRAEAAAANQSPVKIVGGNRPSDERLADDLIRSLVLRLDEFADSMASQVHNVEQVALFFDETDVAKRYEAIIQRTREISHNTKVVKGWHSTENRRVQGRIEARAHAHFRLDTKFIGGVHVVGKAHPLVLATDITTNFLAHHLGKLPPKEPLHAPSSIQGWALAERVWGVSEGASDDLF